VTALALAHRVRWLVLPLATAVAVVGFWVAGQVESRYDGVGLLSLPLFWAAGRFTGWWALPAPVLALVAGVAIGNHAGTTDNEMAWMNYAGGLAFCEVAVIGGATGRPRRPA
jgi:hypothetical protein